MGDKLFNSATIETMLTKPRARWTRDPPDVIPLWLADTDFGVPPEIKATVIAAVENENTFYNFFDRTSEKAMAEKVTRVNNVEASPEDILVTPGVIPGMWMAIKHSMGPGDNAVITNPMYDPFKHMTTTICGHETVEWSLDAKDGYRFDPDNLNETINDRTRLIFVCNPHNPCGRAMTKEELKGIADIAVDNNITVMVDELWEDIVFDGRPHISLASLNPEIEALTMTEYGFSKSYGVAGLQVAYLCATNKETMADIRKKSHHVFHGATNPSKAAAPVMLDSTLDWWRKAQMKHLTKIRAICEKRLGEHPRVHLPKLEATYLMYPRFDYGKTSTELGEYILEEARVSLATGTNYGSNGEGHLRMGIATSEAIMDEALDRITDALDMLP